MANPQEIKAAWQSMTAQERDSFINEISDAEAEKLSSALSVPEQKQNPVTETISNIPGSAANFFGNIATAVAHPVDTAKGLGLLAAGGVDAAARGLESMVTGGNTAQSQPGWEQSRQVANNVGEFYKDRYGGISNIGQTIRTDPVGALADASAVLGLGAGGLRAAGLTKAADIAGGVGKAINPMNMAIEATKATAVPLVKNAYTAIVGQTTGSGKYAVDQAVKGSKEFVRAMRGATTDEQLVNSARDAVSKLKDARTQAYQDSLSGIKGATQTIDISGVKNVMNGLLTRYGVKVKNGALDFSRSTLSDRDAQAVVRSMFNDVNKWGSQSGDLTAVGLDTLKRRIGNLYSPNNDARAMIAGMRDNVHKTISKSVPEYAKMTSDYAKATSTIKEVEKALSVGNKSSIDTAATKLMTAIRKDNDFRRALMQTLDADTGLSIVPSAAGRTMSNLWSNRLSSVATQAMAGGAAIAAGHPLLASLLALSSPRIAGELSVLLGRVSRATGGAVKATAPAAVPLAVSGNLQNINEMGK